MMLEEAIKILKRNRPSSDPRMCGIELCTAVDIAIDCIDKQIPQKPLEKHYEDKGEAPYIKFCCPNGCKIQFIPPTEKGLACETLYCPKCGQKIDWGDN